MTLAAGQTASGINFAMQIGGEITGTVTAAATQAAVPGVSVTVSTADGTTVDTTSTGEAGTYTLAGLAPGSYVVSFVSPKYVSQYYSGAASSASATQVVVAADANTANVNAALQAAGEIKGEVIDGFTQAPLPYAAVLVYDAQGTLATTAYTDANGQYAAGGLSSGTYRVEFEPSGYPGTYSALYYNGQSSLASANGVPVSAGAATSNINGVLYNGGQITGTVTDATTKLPIQNVEVWVFNASGSTIASTTTDANGNYAVEGIAAGTYRVEFYAYTFGANYVLQYYSNEPTLAAANAVAVSVGQSTQNINAALVPGAEISGTVTDAAGASYPGATGPPLPGISVTASSTTGSIYGYATTDSTGHYTIASLPTGTYHVQFNDYTGSYFPQYYNGRADPGATEDPVTATQGQVTKNISAALSPAGRISGTVTDAQTGQPISEAYVTAYTSTGTLAGETYTSSNGTYTLGLLATGTYRVEFGPGYYAQGYGSQYYDAATTLASATGVSVTVAQTTTAINGALTAWPTNLTPPTISGTVQQGQTLTEAHGTWTHLPTSFSYQWERCTSTDTYCSAISGATGQTYVPVAADVGQTLLVEETATNAGGPSAPAASLLTVPVVIAPPVDTTPPTIGGTAQQGKTLTESHGNWTNQPTGYLLQWLQCDSSATTARQSAEQPARPTCR